MKSMLVKQLLLAKILYVSDKFVQQFREEKFWDFGMLLKFHAQYLKIINSFVLKNHVCILKPIV